MNVDPFDSWYAGSIDADEENNFKPGDRDFFTIIHDENSAGDVHVAELEPDQFDSWVDRQSLVRAYIVLNDTQT
jgi:hypothetical protein